MSSVFIINYVTCQLFLVSWCILFRSVVLLFREIKSITLLVRFVNKFFIISWFLNDVARKYIVLAYQCSGSSSTSGVVKAITELTLYSFLFSVVPWKYSFLSLFCQKQIFLICEGSRQNQGFHKLYTIVQFLFKALSSFQFYGIFRFFFYFLSKAYIILLQFFSSSFF